jgi:transcriptional regulator with XRE-family HTH domain
LLRKISAHGLGHLLPPYGEDQAPSVIPAPMVSLEELEAERWQHDLWYRIVEAALTNAPEQVRLDDLPGFGRPAVSRYAATTSKLLRWFDQHNEEKPYREQVKPFGFLLAYQTGASPFPGQNLARPVSAYDSDLGKAAEGCFDRETGKRVPRDQLNGYRDALAQYYLHPESKFHNGDYTDRGFTSRRHVRAMVTEYIGKEANRWEEQYHLGLDPQTQTEYGLSPEGRKRALQAARGIADTHGQRLLAQTAGISVSELSAVLLAKRQPNPSTLAKLRMAVSRLQRSESDEADQTKTVLDEVRRQCKDSSLRRFAARAGIDPANLNRVLKGRSKPSVLMLAKLRSVLAQDR